MQALATLVLILHWAVVLFIVGGLLCTWLGAMLGWRWVRNRWFRTAHLAAIVFVAVQTLLGVLCPLTVLEDTLRGQGEPSGFIERWLRRLLFYDFPPWVFSVSYLGFALLTTLTWLWVPPRKRPSG
jgi:MFS family permease